MGYNTYLADLKTANEKDAFSAFFSPPKKPAMVKRPGAPTTPATYTGLQHWPASQQTLMLKDGTGFPTTDGKQYVLGNNLLGGWGAWTISRLAGDTTTPTPTSSPTPSVCSEPPKAPPPKPAGVMPISGKRVVKLNKELSLKLEHHSQVKQTRVVSCAQPPPPLLPTPVPSTRVLELLLTPTPPTPT